MSKTILLTILALIVAGYAFAADRQAQQANELRIKNITTQQAKELYLKPDHLLLDVRTLEEYQERHIEPSVLIPLQELEARYQELPKDKIILVYNNEPITTTVGRVIFNSILPERLRFINKKMKLMTFMH